MQYLLSEEEYQKFKKLESESKKRPSPIELQAFCSMVSDTLVLESGWMKGQTWGCILTSRLEAAIDDNWYCDDCPSHDVCPYPRKEWSK